MSTFKVTMPPPQSHSKGGKASGLVLMHGGMFSGQRPKLHLPGPPALSNQGTFAAEEHEDKDIEHDDDGEGNVGTAYENPESECNVCKAM